MTINRDAGDYIRQSVGYDIPNYYDAATPGTLDGETSALTFRLCPRCSANPKPLSQVNRPLDIQYDPSCRTVAALKRLTNVMNIPTLFSLYLMGGWHRSGGRTCDGKSARGGTTLTGPQVRVSRRGSDGPRAWSTRHAPVPQPAISHNRGFEPRVYFPFNRGLWPRVYLFLTIVLGLLIWSPPLIAMWQQVVDRTQDRPLRAALAAATQPTRTHHAHPPRTAPRGLPRGAAPRAPLPIMWGPAASRQGRMWDALLN